MPAESDFCAEEEVEKAGGYAAGLDLFGPIGCRDGEAFSGPGVQRVEDLALLLPVEVVAGRGAIAIALLVRPDHNDSVAIHIGERGKQNRIEQAENRCSGPDPQGQGQQGDRGEPCTFPEQPQAVANIAPKFGHKGTSPCLYWRTTYKVPSFRANTEFRRVGRGAVGPHWGFRFCFLPNRLKD